MTEVCNTCEVISPPSKTAVVSLTKHLNPTFSFWKQKRTVTRKNTTRMQSAKSRLKNCMTTDSVSSTSIFKEKGKQESKGETEGKSIYKIKKREGERGKGRGREREVKRLKSNTWILI